MVLHLQVLVLQEVLWFGQVVFVRSMIFLFLPPLLLFFPSGLGGSRTSLLEEELPPKSCPDHLLHPQCL